MLTALKQYFAVENLVPAKHLKGELPHTKDAYQEVLRIALPSIAEMVLMSLIGSIDTIMVGQLGKNALAAVALPGQPRMIMMSVFFALNVGVTAIVARRKGEDRRQDANLTLRNAIVLACVLSIAIMALAVSLSGPLMRLAGGNVNTPDDAQVLGGATAYFQIIAWGLPITAVSMCINAALRGVGNTKVTLQVNMISNVVNVVFNYLLIGGNFGFPRLEVAGAAIASVIGLTVGAVLSFIVVIRGDSTYLHLSKHDSWRIDKPTMRGIIRIGGNAMIEQLSVRIGFFVYSRIMYSMGVTLFAAHNIAMQFLNLTFSLADGTGIAATALVGQNLGARRPDKSMLYGKIAQRIAQVISAVVGILLVVLRFPIAGLFIQAGTPDAGVVVEAAAQTLIVIALMQPFQMGSVVLSGSLRGAGDNMFVAGVMALCVSIIRPLMAVLAVYVFHFGLALTWLFGLSEIALRLFLFMRRFQSGKWMTINV